MTRPMTMADIAAVNAAVNNAVECQIAGKPGDLFGSGVRGTPEFSDASGATAVRGGLHFTDGATTYTATRYHSLPLPPIESDEDAPQQRADLELRPMHTKQREKLAHRMHPADLPEFVRHYKRIRESTSYNAAMANDIETIDGFGSRRCDCGAFIPLRYSDMCDVCVKAMNDRYNTQCGIVELDRANDAIARQERRALTSQAGWKGY